MTDKEFPQGIIAKRNEKAPDFVLCNLSFKVDEFIDYLKENESNWWVNLDVKRSKQGKIYTDKNDWDKDKEYAKAEWEWDADKMQEEIDISDLPF